MKMAVLWLNRQHFIAYFNWIGLCALRMEFVLQSKYIFQSGLYNFSKNMPRNNTDLSNLVTMYLTLK